MPGRARSPCVLQIVRGSPTGLPACRRGRGRSGRRFQPLRKMCLHGLDRGAGVTRHHRGQDGAVFAQGVFNPPLLEKRMVAVELHDLAQVGHHLAAPAVVGQLQQQHVKALVDGKEALALAGGGFQFGVQVLQF